MNMVATIIFIVLIAALIAGAAVTGVKKKIIPMVVCIVVLAGVITTAALVYKPNGKVPVSENLPESSVSSASSNVKNSSSGSSENSSEVSSSESSASSSESQNTSSKDQSSAVSSKATTSKAASSKAASSKAASSKAATSKAASSKATTSKATTSKAASSKTEPQSTTTRIESVPEQPKNVSSAQSEKSESFDITKITIPDLPVSSDGSVTLPFVPFEDVGTDVTSSSGTPSVPAVTSRPAVSRTEALDENETPILSIEEMLPDDWNEEQSSLKDGEYTANRGVVEGSDSVEAEVTVVIKNGKITDVKISSDNKSDEFEEAAKKLRKQIIDEQSADVNPVTGDNVISRAILGAAQDAINSANA